MTLERHAIKSRGGTGVGFQADVGEIDLDEGNYEHISRGVEQTKMKPITDSEANDSTRRTSSLQNH